MHQRLKPERVQDRFLPVTLEHLQSQQGAIGKWQVDATPNAITRHFPQPDYAASAAFVDKAAPELEKHGCEPTFVIDASGVTVRLGNPLGSGVHHADLDLAAALTAIS